MNLGDNMNKTTAQVRLIRFEHERKPAMIGLLKQFGVLPLVDVPKAVDWFNRVHDTDAKPVCSTTLDYLPTPKAIKDFLLRDWPGNNPEPADAFWRFLCSEGIGRAFNVIAEIPDKDVQTLVRIYGDSAIVCLD